MSEDILKTEAHDRLKGFIERVENIEVEIKEGQEARKEVYAEAKGEGFDVKALKKVVRLRKIDKRRREEEEAVVQLYLDATGE